VTAAAHDAVRVRGRWRLCGWCAAAVLVEVGLYASYRGHDARFHWFTHFFVGATAALGVMTAFVVVRRRPVARPLVWPLAAHVFAMAPDLAFTAGYAHRRWMDLFLGHVTVHFVPGRNWTWLAVFLTALAAYLTTIDRTRSPAGRARAAGTGSGLGREKLVSSRRWASSGSGRSGLREERL